jgi:hypothetical protein
MQPGVTRWESERRRPPLWTACTATIAGVSLYTECWWSEKRQFTCLIFLPMFTDPDHAIQAILEATFTDDGGNPQAAYVEDRRRTGTRMYTLEPKRFVLSDLVSADPGDHPPRRTLNGAIVRGHFERGGTPILEDVVVEVTNIVHFRELDPDTQELPQLRYLLFGKGSELFLAHLITNTDRLSRKGEFSPRKNKGGGAGNGRGAACRERWARDRRDTG